MVPVLIWVLIIVVICGLLVYLVKQLPLEPPFRNIALVVIVVVAILVLLQLLLGIVPWPGGRLP